MPTVQGTDLETLRGRVRAALDEQRSLGEVERDLLTNAELDDDLRDALWLYAWSYREAARRRGRPGRALTTFRRH
jgi:hypothetical protein